MIITHNLQIRKLWFRKVSNSPKVKQKEGGRILARLALSAVWPLPPRQWFFNCGVMGRMAPRRMIGNV